MNPRYRRLLIPGLLIALLVIVLISSMARRADGSTTGPDVVSRITDARITESSGLAISGQDADLAYTINDSGSAAVVFAIQISTGAVVGTTTLEGGQLLDTEALAIDDDGTLWVADTGDNRGVRDDIALYAFPEQGAGDHRLTPTAYPLTYDGGPRDVETLVVEPGSGAKFLLSKGLFGGEVLAVPQDLEADRPNQVEVVQGDPPGVLTDGAFTPDGEAVVVRDYGAAYVLDPSTWEQVRSAELPATQQGETLAMEPEGRSFLIGSEGSGSPLIRVPFTAPSAATQEPTSEAPAVRDTTPDSTPPGSSGFAGATWFWAVLVVALLATVSIAASRRSR